jgi:hypothetical protein
LSSNELGLGINFFVGQIFGVVSLAT